MNRYDMDFSGAFWALNSFVRDVAAVETASIKGPLNSQTNLYQ